MNNGSEGQTALTRIPDVPIPTGTPFLTARQAACYLQVSVGQLYNLVSQRRLPVYKSTARLRIHKKDLDDFLQAGFRPAAPTVTVGGRHW